MSYMYPGESQCLKILMPKRLRFLVCCIPKEKVTDLVEDRAEILLVDPLGHLRNNFQSPLAEVKLIYYVSLYNSLYKV